MQQALSGRADNIKKMQTKKAHYIHQKEENVFRRRPTPPRKGPLDEQSLITLG